MSEKRESLFKYYLFVILAGTCWGMTGTLQALAPEGANSATIGAVRLFVAGVLLLAYALFSGGLAIFQLKISRWALFIIAAAQLAYQMSFFTAVRMTGVALGTMIAIGLSPAVAGLMGRLFYGESLTRRWYFATAAALFGCTMLILGRSQANMEVNLLGCLLAAVAALSYSFIGVGLRVAGKADAVQVTSLSIALAGLFALPVLVVGDSSWMASLHGVSVVLVLSTIATIAPMVLFARGVQKIQLGSAYTLSMAEPLTASLLAVFLLRERLPLISLLGAALMLCSLYILAKAEN